MKNNFFLILFSVLALTMCQGNEVASVYPLSDKDATPNTKVFYENLGRLAQKKVMFGHQHSTEYGHDWSDRENWSDVKDVTGTHAAVQGADFGDIYYSDPEELASAKKKTSKLIQDTYDRGGVMTFCWHLHNLTGEGDFNWTEGMGNVVARLIPGGDFNERYKQLLRDIADVVKDTETEEGGPVPVIFRPWHEFDGEWFWWGFNHCSKEEFVTLWRFTVDYLRKDLDVHNLIFAFSPDCRFLTKEQYLDRYPGDDYVDILGLDDYWDFRPDGADDPELVRTKLKIITELAEEKHKVAAFTETGLESVADPVWFTNELLPILKDPEIKVSYVLVWRNAYKNAKHYFAPFKGHPASDDFIKFYEDDMILFEDEIPDNIYSHVE